jgi:ATPase subunit of ABC transporter with duplicated ATPase domains
VLKIISASIVSSFEEIFMLILQNIAYSHPDKNRLFEDVNLSIDHHNKIALIGNNGIGKSTLLRIIAGLSEPTSGTVSTDSEPYYVPQHFGQFNHTTVAQALRVDEKITALKQIITGNVTDELMTILDDDWTVEERCIEALSRWGLGHIDLSQPMETLSGGQKTKVFLAGIDVHKPHIVLLDEPTNHLDAKSRDMLYDFIHSTTNTLIVVSHDRTLLNQLDTVCELTSKGLNTYGGNFEFYKAQKAIEADALNEDLKSKEKALRKAKMVERESMERQQKLDARGRKKQEKAGLPTISMNTLRNNAEKSTSRVKEVHAAKIEDISEDLHQLRKALPDKDKMRIGFDDSALHRGKILFKAQGINHSYNDHKLWQQSLDLMILSGDRIAIKGSNGSGKTTLIKIILGQLQPAYGSVQIAGQNAIYVDQDYSLIDSKLRVYEQAQQFNNGGLQEHEVKSRLTHFLFTKAFWDKDCSALSGGEKMRLILCCLSLKSKAPDMIILDEPTNNLDLQNIEILTGAIEGYSGTLIVVSHDVYFLEQIVVEKVVELK